MSDYTAAVEGLLRKRADLTSELEGLRIRIDAALDALNHIDASIRVFRPDISPDLLPDRPAPPAGAAFRGEVQRFLLDQLRNADRPLKTSELGEAVMVARKLNLTDRILLKLVTKRAGNSLRKLARDGSVTGRRYGSGPELEWRLV